MDKSLLPYLTDAERDWLALAEAATPGPWETNVFGVWSPAEDWQVFYSEGYADETDAAFIAASRTAVPAALEALALARRDAEKLDPRLKDQKWRCLVLNQNHDRAGAQHGQCCATTSSTEETQ